MTINTVTLGRIIEEALNDHDDTELMSVLNSFTIAEWLAIAAALQGKADSGRTPDNG